MFKCEKCLALESALAFERARNKDLMDRLMALADARAYQAVKFDYTASDASNYYGGDDDMTEMRNEFGEKILVKVNNDERPV